eukprot:GEMP01000409.1.p1 GENE.GEMP01000409.1~~GEMP01000409.1.p1  ORF type:complete len:1601 (+),score=465.87 GEMP01000409.1:27-4829(+)
MARVINPESKKLSPRFLDSHMPARELSPRGTLFLRVRFEATIPKLLVKISIKDTGRRLSVPNLGEVMLRSNGKERIAVINISSHVEAGEIVMSLKLAEMLKVVEGHTVEVTPAPGSGKQKPSGLQTATWDSFVGRPSVTERSKKTQEATRLRTMLSEALSSDANHKYAGSMSARGNPAVSPRQSSRLSSPSDYPSMPDFRARNISAVPKNVSYPKTSTYNPRSTSPTYYSKSRSSASSSSAMPWAQHRNPSSRQSTAPPTSSRYSTAAPPSSFRHPAAAPPDSYRLSSAATLNSTRSSMPHTSSSRQSTAPTTASTTPFRSVATSDVKSSTDAYWKQTLERKHHGKSSTTTPDSLPSSSQDEDDEVEDFASLQRGRVPWQKAFVHALQRKISDLSDSELKSSSEEPPLQRRPVSSFTEGVSAASHNYSGSNDQWFRRNTEEPSRQVPTDASSYRYDFSHAATSRDAANLRANLPSRSPPSATRPGDLSARARFSLQPEQHPHPHVQQPQSHAPTNHYDNIPRQQPVSRDYTRFTPYEDHLHFKMAEASTKKHAHAATVRSSRYSGLDFDMSEGSDSALEDFSRLDDDDDDDLDDEECGVDREDTLLSEDDEDTPPLDPLPRHPTMTTSQTRKGDIRSQFRTNTRSDRRQRAPLFPRRSFTAPAFHQDLDASLSDDFSCDIGHQSDDSTSSSDIDMSRHRHPDISTAPHTQPRVRATEKHHQNTNSHAETHPAHDPRDVFPPHQRNHASTSTHGALRFLLGRSVSAPVECQSLVTYVGNGKEETVSGGKKQRRRSKEVNLGSLQVDEVQVSPVAQRIKLPRTVRPPKRTSDSLLLEVSELGADVLDIIRQWLDGKRSGRHIAHLMSDRCSVSLANARSGFGQTIIGGPLGAVVGGHTEGRTMYEEIFKHSPEIAVRDAFHHFGFKAKEGTKQSGNHDWSNISLDEVSLVYRRYSLKNHPNRGGSMAKFLKTQSYMEILRAFTASTTPTTQLPFIDDSEIVKELKRSWSEVEEDAKKMTREQLRHCNKFFDDYILRQMRFKSEVIDEMARLHENAAYAILGVDPLASDEQIKRAYRQIAMACHPDKGGDKEDFQELTNAYEKIMGQRRGDPRRQADDDDDDFPTTQAAPKPECPPEREEASKPKPAKAKETVDSKGSDDDDKSCTESNPGDESSQDEDEFGPKDAPRPQELLKKVAKAAEEASRFANTAADFAQQVTDASKTARKAAESELAAGGNRDCRLTRTIAHSAIVLTLTVVKAVRVVGYAALDSAAHALHASKQLATTPQCAAAAASAMSSGFEALNAASTCAQATEAAAAELQAATSGKTHPDPNRLSDAATQAAVAATAAAHAAIAAAIAAAEASKQTNKVVTEWIAKNEKEKAEKADKEAKPKEKRKRSKEKKTDSKDDAQDKEKTSSEDKDASSGTTTPAEPKEAEEKEESRFLAQRVNNHKLLQRLNAEILGYQMNVKSFLDQNSLLIPEVSMEQKADVFGVLADYIAEAQARMNNAYRSGQSCDEIFCTLLKTPPLASYMLGTPLAITVNVESRVLKTAQMLDCKFLWQSISTGIFDLLEQLFPALPGRVGRIKSKIKEEILSLISEKNE